MARNYKEEYEKFQKEKSSYRAKLNKYNRDKGTYGNEGKAEKSRLKGSKRKFLKGGKLKGKSHAQGGIPIEAEGGEFIIRKSSVNKDTIDTLKYINTHGDLPVHNAKKRRK